jgi:hypothetical protein
LCPRYLDSRVVWRDANTVIIFAIDYFCIAKEKTVTRIGISTPRTMIAALALLLLAGIAIASTSNKWRLQFSGGADSNGVIVLTFTPVGGEPITVDIAVKDGTPENGVARTVTEALKASLPKDGFHVERDDGEDVLIKQRHGAAEFGIEIVSNSVEGVRINPDRE